MFIVDLYSSCALNWCILMQCKRLFKILIYKDCYLFQAKYSLLDFNIYLSIILYHAHIIILLSTIIWCIFELHPYKFWILYQNSQDLIFNIEVYKSYFFSHIEYGTIQQYLYFQNISCRGYYITRISKSISFSCNLYIVLFFFQRAIITNHSRICELLSFSIFFLDIK